MALQTVWFLAIAVLWTGFLLLEGFDFGVAALVPVLGRDAEERGLLLRTIGPVWDGNEVWLITAAGAVFAAFPGWYAAWLPALYLPFVLVLLALIVRAVGFEWRHSHHDPRWDALWTRVITIGSVVAALGVGAALGATTLGLPLGPGGVRIGGAFSGVGWPALLGGVAVLSFSVAHGAVFLALKTDGPVRERARALAERIVPFAALPLLAWAAIVGWREGTVITAVTWVIAVVTVVLTWLALRARREGLAFLGWSGMLLASATTIFGAAYPVVVPSTISSAYDVTISTASVSSYTLTFITWVAAIGLPVVLGYQAWSYWVFRKRITAHDVAPGKPAPQPVSS